MTLVEYIDNGWEPEGEIDLTACLLVMGTSQRYSIYCLSVCLGPKSPDYSFGPG